MDEAPKTTEAEPPRADAITAAAGPFGIPPLLFQEHYKWFIFLSALDALLTVVVLTLGGIEVNVIANKIIQILDMPGLFGFKIVMVAFIVLLIETIGRLNQATGIKIARLAVLITAFPVLAASLQLGLVAATWWRII